MKKLFLALLFSAVLFIGLPFYNVNAMEVTYDVPFTAIPDLTDLLLGMLSGGKYDLSEVSTLEEAAEQHKNSLKNGYHFLQRMAQNLWNWQVTQAGLGNTSLTQDTDMTVYVSPADLAAYMGYNLKWWERDQIVDNIITVNPDANYSSYIDYINNTGFTIKNYNQQVYNDGTNRYLTYPLSLLSYTSNNSWQTWSANSILSIYITGDNNSFSFSTSTSLVSQFRWSASDYRNSGALGNSSYINNGLPYVSAGNNQFDTTYSITGTLDEVFQYIQSHFRNVNIYVNGVCWAYVLEQPTDYITAPDVYGVGNTGIDIFDVFYPGLTQDYGGISINGFLEWLKGKLGSKDVGLDDLIEDAPDIVIGLDENDEPTTRPITNEDTRPAPIVIEEEGYGDPDPDNPTPTPTPDPSTFPLPPFPNFPIPSDIPNANIQHTVLAEIIDATQSVVPQDLMVLIWATFSLLIIGGIIYILHK